MIISAIRRTDIPSYYAEWFYNRMQDGYVLVRNPMNFHQISRVNLAPEVIDGIVFLTKNPSPMLSRLDELDKYTYYFQLTLTPYREDIEPGLPSKRNVIIPSFIELSNRIGADRVIWRYDPVLLNEMYTVEKHFFYFEMLGKLLKGYTRKCIISFVDMYKNTVNNDKELKLQRIKNEDMHSLAKGFSVIAKQYGIELCTCSEQIDLSGYGISHAHCIDKELLEYLGNCPLNVGKDKNQRTECGCVESIDIGAYNSCKNLCKYCYANYNANIIDRNFQAHNPTSPLLYGEVGDLDRITERKVQSFKDVQMRLF
ncbi:DUF1848 domain-containing protein [Blautia schinkii]|nr:DUF1848 domain-containing protein [Blautia schinkii]